MTALHPSREILQSPIELGEIVPNIATMLQANVKRYADRTVFQEKVDGRYDGISWQQLYEDIRNIAFNLQTLGVQRGDKMVLFSRNCLEMLELELALMATGGIAVPIFANFKKNTADLLIEHSDAKYLAVAGHRQLENVSPGLMANPTIIFEDGREGEGLIPFSTLLDAKSDPGFDLDISIDPDTICLNMYTSGTMGIPKCVQLTHKNILSQQAALDKIWTIDENDRFLSYLPWHHSFGGIFELFTALYHGATISLESSYGKDPKTIMENWKLIRPTLFFSVPKVYQALVDLTRSDKEAENSFFNSGLKFIFTAAAPLPEILSDEFERRGINVIEGWGLTETSPCCTLTDPGIKRETGVVGQPIPGVSIRINSDQEIEVKGPNVMVGYYKNDEANRGIFTDDGWYRTGDVGGITEAGLKLIARKDRIFKLSNGEKVVPTDLEKLIEKKCHYVSFALVTGVGEEYPVALLFPNKKLLDDPDYHVSPMEGCFCPRNVDELGKCLHGCLHDANCGIGQKFAKIKAAAIIDDELSLENNTLTPSMKVAPNQVIKTYKAHLQNLYGANVPVDEEVYVINLGHKEKVEV